MSKSIALIGNPNCGKTTLFNRLTGASQKIGNWPGVTVEQHHGVYTDPFLQTLVNVIDLPGCYSLVATDDMALDEKITCEYLLNAKNTLYVNVLDAAHLDRDLYLTLQLLELKVPMIVVLNCMDLLKAQGLEIDVVALANQLGCSVVAISAKNGTGIRELQTAVNTCTAPSIIDFKCPDSLAATTELWQQYCTPGETIRVLEGDILLAQKLPNIEDVNLQRAALQNELGFELDVYIAKARRNLLTQILEVTQKRVSKNSNLSNRIDGIVLHKIYGPMIFLGVMYLLFTCAINVGGMLQVCFEHAAEGLFVTQFNSWLLAIGTNSWLANFLTEGLGRGVSITLTFTPVLATMFFCLGILESTGYMIRAAFIVDRLMHKLGLSGRAFVPMIVGFGCNVPAIMGTRSLTNQRERILTIMMTPFMSCSARLAIYAIFVAAFFPTGGQNVIFSLYVIGILVAILTARLLRNSLVTSAESMSIMEMPDYRWPMLRGLLRQTWYRLKSFLVKAGILIVVLCVVINGLGTPMLEAMGKFLTPLFAPIGISADNWPATISLVTGLLAKEAVVGTLNAFYASEHAMIEAFGGPIAAYSYLLFTLLYFPCVSVVAAIAKELNLRWAMFSVVWSTGLAYLIAALFFQIASLNSWTLITLMGVLLIGFFITARSLVKMQVLDAVKVRKVLPTAIVVN